jgi:uncharacterized protein (TIGR01777 family)
VIRAASNTLEFAVAPSPHGRIVIAGGSGFLGLNLARYLADAGRPVTILSRSAPPPGPWTHARWDGRTPGDWVSALDGCAGIVNLAGRTVDCIKTPLHCDQILRSRVEATRVLGEAVRRAAPPPVWVQMSTAHIYGDSELPCDETAATGYGLAPTVGHAWERAFDEACPDGVRRVILRTSFVLGRSGGALPRLAGLARVGLGGTVGSGRQGMSWIHETDMNALFERGLDDPSMRGVYIASAPNPVSNRDFMRSLRRAVRAPVGLPAMGWMVKVGAPLFLRTDPELALYGRYCRSARLEAEGFAFRFPDLDGALADLYARKA